MRFFVIVSWLTVSLIAATGAGSVATSAQAQTSNPDSASAASASRGSGTGKTSAAEAADLQQLIDTLNDPVRRSALIGALENARKSVPAATVPTPATSSTTPSPATPAHAASSTPAAAATPAAAKAATAASVAALKPDSLGAQLIARGVALAASVSGSFLLAARGFAGLPDLLRWLRSLAEDPAVLVDGAISAGRLLAILLVAVTGEYLAWRLTHRFYATLATGAHQQDNASSREVAAATTAEDRDGWSLLRRLPFILVAATVDLLPPLAFLAIATALLGTPLAATNAVRTVTLAVVDAYFAVRAIGVIARATFGAPSSRLRLLPAADDTARYLMVRVRRIAVVIVFGYALSQVALLFGMNTQTQQGLLRLISLVVHLLLAVMVLQCRTQVAAWLRGPETGTLAPLRHMLASVWHIYAIMVIACAWIIYASASRDGFEQLIHFMLSTILVALAARVADIVLEGALDRGFSLSATDDTQGGTSRLARFEEHVARYHTPLLILLRVVICVAAAIALLQVWGIDALGWFDRGALGGRLASSAVTLILTLGVAVVVWEAITVAMQVYLDELAQQGAVVRAARLRTVVPLLRNTLLIVLMVLIVMTALSEFGVNIGPLLAGASIFGVAIGFGSQKLVQDFITGIFLLLENAMQVGDNVTAGGLSGTVENLSIRTLRLRAGDGSVHIIPFSSVSTVTNSNRGLGNAAVSITVDYDEDIDKVIALLTGIVQEMRGEDAYSKGMLSDLQLWGVDHIDGTTVTLAGQIACTDAGRWGVQREFNRRVRIAFQKAGIRMTPPVTISGFRHPLDIRVEQTGSAKKVGPAEKAGAAARAPEPADAAV